MDNNSLTHYGVLGMRWGVRRSKAQLRRARGPNSGPRKVSKEVYEAEKAKAINSGNVKKVEAWKDKLTDQELRQAINRCKLNKELADINADQRKSGLDVVEDVMNNVGRVTNVVNTGLNAYSAVAKINNTFNSKQLPVIDGENARAKRQAENKKKADVAEILKLVDSGKSSEVLDKASKYDPEALKDVAKRYENASSV